jgi:hypothetical protein
MTIEVKDLDNELDIEKLGNNALMDLHWAVSQEIDRRGGAVDSYAAPHVWNLVAKILREEYSRLELDPEWERRFPDNANKVHLQRRTIEMIAMDFAKRFAEDDGFDPLSWLDKCSPDTELYPFSEMWDEGSPDEWTRRPE